jgi:hypothetical protein
VSRFHAAFTQAQALTSIGDKPLIVLTAAGTVTDTRGWLAAQNKLASLSTNVVHRTIDTDHSGLLESEPGATSTAGAIDMVVVAVRTGQTLT